ncbi:vacuolar membrane protein-domain-containing protein [Rhodofomes roseus]|uniref:Vacuolar membrane protein-domain-containing protein n=1 Tax=Rhodofomes roseus TaxID=34475 RepID=A0ABQ8K9V8_9APHY|nr:vacuolar membrane protein-domain-containing protein [Rhodofomes roseus]KAH9833660.1 vacuolar membrane protein-domain-containing protein [Rhodofomes roseus]
MADKPDSFFDDYPDVDQSGCRLLGPTALVTQGLMGVLVVASLIYKRHRESPRRPWRIWLFDVSKQVIGQMVIHGVNVLVSDTIAHLSSGNACVFYFLNILLDTTIGVGIIYFILHITTWLLSEKCQLKGFESGQYGSPPSFNYWIRQATVYIFSLLSMKMLVIALFAVWPGIFMLGDWLLTFLGPSDAVQVIFTMGLFPIMMNIIQFWLIDSIVKSSQAAAVALPTLTPRSSTDGEHEHEPLFRASSDDEDNDGAFPARHDIENPRPRSRSLSADADRLGLPDEPKSLGSGTSTAVGSTPGTPKPKPIDIKRGVEAHAYPPSLAGSSVDTSSSAASSLHGRSRSPRAKRKHSPPPALPLQPMSPQAERQATRRHTHSDSLTPKPADTQYDEKEWADWGDEGDNWAERVGEEEWTGRRMEARKGELDNVWARQHSAALSIS